MSLDAVLESSGAIMRGHFILSSGRHSDVYIEKFRVLEQPEVNALLCARIAERFKNDMIELVAGPATGGLIVAYETARQLGCRALYVETEAGRKTLRRGAQISPGSRVLLVDDVLTTGLSLKETAEAVRAEGGNLVGAAVLIDRSSEAAQIGVPVFGAHKVEAVSYSPDELPAALAKVPAVKPGTRRQV